MIKPVSSKRTTVEKQTGKTNNMPRLLTTGEIAAAKQLFKGSVNYSLVKFHNKKYVFLQLDNSGMTPNGEIYVHGIYSQDYAKEASALTGFFIHELVHV